MLNKRQRKIQEMKTESLLDRQEADKEQDEVLEGGQAVVEALNMALKEAAKGGKKVKNSMELHKRGEVLEEEADLDE